MTTPLPVLLNWSENPPSNATKIESQVHGAIIISRVSGKWGNHFVVVVYIAILLIGFREWSLGHQLGVSAEFRSEQGFITDVVPGGAAWKSGVKIGDEIITVDGAPIDGSAWALSGDNAKTMETRDSLSGETRHVAPENPDSSSWLAFIPYFVIASAFTSLWVLIQLVGTRQVETQIGALTMILIAGAVAVGPAAALARPVALVIEGILLPVSIALLSTTVLVRKNEDGSVMRWRLAISRVLILLAVPVSVIQTLAYTGSISEYDIVASVFYLFVIMAFSVVLVGVAVNMITASDAVQKERSKAIALAFAIGVLPLLLLSIVPTAIFGRSFVEPELTVTSFAIVPVALGYTISTSQQLQMRRLMHQSVSIVVVLVFGLLFHGVAVIAIRNSISLTTEFETVISWIMFGVFATLAMTTGSMRTAGRITDRILFKISVNHGDIARKITASAARQTTVAGLASDAMYAMEHGIQLESARFLQIEPNGGSSILLAGKDMRTKAGVSVIDTVTDLVDHPDIGVISKISESPALYALYGRKIDGSDFDGADIQLIQTVQELLGIAMNRLSTLTQLNRKTDELRAISQQLVELDEHALELASAEIHDEPLQQLYYLISRSSHEGMSDEHRSKLVDVASQLRSISSALSPMELNDFGLLGAIESLADQLRDRIDVELTINTTGIEDSLRFSNKMELSVYRVVQESFSNISKHSSATKVNIEIDNGDEGLTIIVSDNGLGISKDAPVRLGLSGMRARVLSLNGNIAIEPNDPSGTNLTVYIPHEKKDTNGI